MKCSVKWMHYLPEHAGLVAYQSSALRCEWLQTERIDEQWQRASPARALARTVDSSATEARRSVVEVSGDPSLGE
jgi:hypothetical protein